MSCLLAPTPPPSLIWRAICTVSDSYSNVSCSISLLVITMLALVLEKDFDTCTIFAKTFIPIMFVSFLIHALYSSPSHFPFQCFSPLLVPAAFYISTPYFFSLPFWNSHPIQCSHFYWFLSLSYFNSLHSPFRFISSESVRVLPLPQGF